MCAPLSAPAQAYHLARSRPVETVLTVTCVALAVLAVLQLASVIGGPPILKLISFVSIPASLFLAVYCFYRIFELRKLAAFGLSIEDHSEAKGNCLFENALPQINRDISAEELRRQTVQYMRGDTETFGALDAAYFTKMERPTEWCTEIEVRALALYTGQPLLVIDQDQRTKAENIHSTLAPIFLYLQNGNHFVMCKPFPELNPREIFDEIVGPE